MNLYDLRQNYTLRGLDVGDLEADPFLQFEKWFIQAREAGFTEPNAMSLATCDASGIPCVRTVLLKSFDSTGFVFYTNYESRKGREMADNPKVSLLFPWLVLERQVQINGRVEKVSRKETSDYFSKRPYESQLGAAASPQSEIIPSRKSLEERFQAYRALHPEGAVPVPENWGGYRVVPETVEFWQGRPGRLHDRLVYGKSQSGWVVHRLAP